MKPHKNRSATPGGFYTIGDSRTLDFKFFTLIIPGKGNNDRRVLQGGTQGLLAYL